MTFSISGCAFVLLTDYSAGRLLIYVSEILLSCALQFLSYVDLAPSLH